MQEMQSKMCDLYQNFPRPMFGLLLTKALHSYNFVLSMAAFLENKCNNNCHK